MDSIQSPEENLQCLSAEDTVKVLRSRIGEQSNLICTLKQKADELFLRCQVLQNDNAELEGQVTDRQKELDGQRKKAELLEERCDDLAANDRGMISNMDECKSQNAQLKLENEHLQTEKTLLSQKLHDKQQFTQKLLEEIKLLTEKGSKEKEYGEKQVTDLQAKETSLLEQIRHSQKLQRDAEEMCKDVELNLLKLGKENSLREISLRGSITRLTKEKDELLHLSVEKGKAMQDKEEEVRQLGRKLKEENKARVEAEDRFGREAEAVNANAKVKSLQSALDESMRKYGNFKKEFEAFKEHCAKQLAQERELNEKLRHMTG